MPCRARARHFLQELAFDFAAFGRIRAQIEKEMPGFESKELRGADEVGESEFLADAK